MKSVLGTASLPCPRGHPGPSLRAAENRNCLNSFKIKLIWSPFWRHKILLLEFSLLQSVLHKEPGSLGYQSQIINMDFYILIIVFFLFEIRIINNLSYFGRTKVMHKNPILKVFFWRFRPKQQVRNLRQFDEENEMFHDSFIIPCKVRTWTQINHPGRNFCGARLSGVHFIYHKDEN